MSVAVIDNAVVTNEVQTKPAANEAISRQLRWRYAVKKFDSSRKLAQKDWETIKEALTLAPSSFGLQPWKFVVVKDPAVRDELRHAAWGQTQIADASHLVVLTVKADIDAAYVDRYIARIAEVRGVSAESLKGFRDVMVGFVDGLRTRSGNDAVNAWSGRQVYIALGQALETAALLGVDACPMEGFDPAKFDEILGLAETGYATLGVLTLGYRAADDGYAGATKVRFAEEDVLVEV